MLPSLLLSKRQISLFFFYSFDLSDFVFFPFHIHLSQLTAAQLSVISSSAKPCKSYIFPERNVTDSGKLLQSVSVYELTFAAQKVLHCKMSTRLQIQ